MPEFLIPLTLAVIAAGAALCVALIWAWRRELAGLFGIGERHTADLPALIHAVEDRVAVENELATAIERRWANWEDLKRLKENASEVATILKHLKTSAERTQ